MAATSVLEKDHRKHERKHERTHQAHHRSHRAASSDRRTSEFSLIGGENFLVDEIWLAK